jgi:hypothetical protein
MPGEETRTYNGWPSYETWLVYTWLTNDADTYALVCAVVQEAARSGGWAGEALNAFVEDNAPPVEAVGLHQDLLTAAYGHVDWDRLAEAFDDTDQ